MNWNIAVIVVLGSVSCSILLCSADARYYRSPNYGRYSTPSKINKYTTSSYSSGKYGARQSSSGHHHNYYQSKITYTGPSAEETNPRFTKPVIAKNSRITKKPVTEKIIPTTAVPVRIVPTAAPTPAFQPRVRVVEQPIIEQDSDIITNFIPSSSGEAPVVQQRVLAPIPAVPDRPVQPEAASSRQAAVPPRLIVPTASNDLILPNMILEAIPAVPEI